MIAVIIGTRPELIKMAPILRRLHDSSSEYVFIHSNQHYSPELDESIMRDLGLPKPHYHLQVGSGTQAKQTANILIRAEEVLLRVKPKVVVVHGDTNTSLGGALAAKKLSIPVAHVEAGLRSFDMSMPEELNRIVIDRISNLLFAPTKIARKNLLRDGLDKEKIFVTGNTIVEAVNEHSMHADKYEGDLTNVVPESFFLSTLHRPENVDKKESLEACCKLLEHIVQRYDQKIILPLHPRTKKSLEVNEIKLPEGVLDIGPVGYIEMLWLLKRAEMVITDSGGIQEEAYILRKPLVTMRTSTERPETLSANFIVGTDIVKFDNAMRKFKEGKVKWKNSLGLGNASDVIIDILKKYEG